MTDCLRAWRKSGAEKPAPTNPAQRWAKTDTRKTAIEAFCWQCMGGSEDAANGARASIRTCPSGPKSVNPCPLWQWRPYK